MSADGQLLATPTETILSPTHPMTVFSGTVIICNRI